MDGSSADSIDSETSSDRYARTFEFTETLTPSVAIVEAVSDVTGTDPKSSPPLHEVVDADALDVLLTESNSNPETRRVTFEYQGHEVTIVGDGTVYVRPAQGNTR
ncbi:MAG: HalOD1 output domain-containing protein [Halobacteriota archaeon]